MLWNFFEISVNIYESFLMIYFLKSRLHFKKISPTGDLLCLISCTLFYSLYLFFDISLNDIFCFIFPLLYALILSDARPGLSLFWVSTLAVLFSSTIGVSTHFSNTIFPQYSALLVAPGLYRLIYVLASNLILSIVIFSASRIRKDIFDLSWTVMLIFLFISISILVSEECLYQLQIATHFNSYFFAFGYLSLLICSILSIFLFHFMAESANQEHQYKTELHAIRLSQKYQEEFTSIYHDFMIKEHDFKHQLETLKTLIDENNNVEAQNYLNSYTSQLQNIRPFMTGCLAVDALLTSKALTMKSKNIDFKFNPYPLNSLPLSAPDFCSIVGNLLDNAIEGTQRIHSSDSPYISLSFARTYDVFLIVCKNSCNPETIRFTNHSWLSSKTNDSHSEIHGIGIHSIERIINNAQGYSSFSVDGCTFVAELTIPFLTSNN